MGGRRGRRQIPRCPIEPTYERVAKRRGAMIARIAAARKLLSLVYYGLRDGEVRCLADKEAG